LQAEDAAEIKGSMVLGFGNAAGKKGVGSIGHQHRLKLADVPLEDSSAITCRTASAGPGGTIELRADKPDGELLASMEIKPTGDWDKWTETSVSLPVGKGRRDVWVVFVKPGVSGGMMNLDWVQFEAK
jgi:cytochrome c